MSTFHHTLPYWELDTRQKALSDFLLAHFAHPVYGAVGRGPWEGSAMVNVVPVAAGFVAL